MKNPTAGGGRIIAYNTLLLYGRTILTSVVSLFTARYVLAFLGVTDYGLFNLIAGLILSLGFINAALAGGTQRFINIDHAANDPVRTAITIRTALVAHLLIAVVVFVVAETAGRWFLETRLNIPLARKEAALIVFHIAAVGAFFTILQVPLNANILANEHLKFYSLLGVLEVLIRFLVIAGMIVLDPPFRLELWAGANLILIALITLSCYVYNRSRLSAFAIECKSDWLLMKEMVSFSGWSLIGNIAHIVMTQGMNFLTNVFFGVALNAARAVTDQVVNTLNAAVSNIVVAVNPRITKLYAEEDTERLSSLVFTGSRLAFLVLFIVTAPIVTQIEWILGLWLGEYPEAAPRFIQINLFVALVYSLTQTHLTAIMAAGKIKTYQLQIAATVNLSFVAVWVLLKRSFGAETPYYVYAVVACVVFSLRVYHARQLAGLSVRRFSRECLKPLAWVVFPSLVLMFYIKRVENQIGFHEFVSVLILVLFIGSLGYLFALTPDEKDFVKKRIVNLMKV